MTFQSRQKLSTNFHGQVLLNFSVKHSFSWLSLTIFLWSKLIFMVSQFHSQNFSVSFDSIATQDFMVSIQQKISYPISCVSFHSNNSEFLQLIFRAFVLHFENLCECFGFEKNFSWTVESWSWLFVVSFTSSSLISFLMWCPWHNIVWRPCSRNPDTQA